MRKLILMLFAVMLIVSMVVPAYAVTPGFHAPDIPDFSDIKFEFKFELPDSFWDGWFNEHPINWKPVVKIELPDDFWKDFKFDFGG